MKKNFICVLFTFTFETAKWITLYNGKERYILLYNKQVVRGKEANGHFKIIYFLETVITILARSV